MGNRTQIRRAEKSDIGVMVRLLSQLFSIETDFTPDADRQVKGLELLLDLSDAEIAVAEEQGVVVGMATVQTLISTAEGGPVGLVEDVVVDAEHRGKGVGSALLRYLDAWAKSNGLSRLQLAADCRNSTALNFYDRSGWQQTRMVVLRFGGFR